MERLGHKSADILDDKVRQLGRIFPECLTEMRGSDGQLKRAVNFDLLKEILSGAVNDNPEAYDFTWVGKNKARAEAYRRIDKTLRPCVGDSVDWDHTKNLYIEGDNLDVLKLLQQSYMGQVKMIYIDPPYNTGRDFIYRDRFEMERDEYDEGTALFDVDGNKNFVENPESNPRFHSDWCTMIYPRLLLARNLLSDDGVIFISIDDNEQANLKKICDEVFGANNFIAQITVVANPRGRDYGGIARMHDYILVYQKSDALKINLIKDEDNHFEKFDSLGGFELRELRNRNVKFNNINRPNLYYPFYIDVESADENGLHKISLEYKEGWLKLYPLESQGIKTVWRWGKEKSLANLNINIMAKPMNNGSYMIVEKYREAKKMARSVWWDKISNTEKGTLLVKDTFKAKVFDYPKPMEMISRMIEMATDKDALVMDFFSGSGTTGHAVMALNAEDGGRRRFILVQLDEKCDKKSEAAKAGYETIFEIGRRRLLKAGQMIKEQSPLTTTDLDVGFRVLKLDESNYNDVFLSVDELTQDKLAALEENIKEGRTALDLLFGCLIDWRVPLDQPCTSETFEGATIYNYGDGALMACFDKNLSRSTVEHIAKAKPIRAVFRDAGFVSDADKINAGEIFKLYAPGATVKII